MNAAILSVMERRQAKAVRPAGTDILVPGTVLKLLKLWPNARKQGHEVGEIWRVGYYTKNDGLETIWLVDRHGSYCWTADREFIADKFSIEYVPRNRSLYGVGKPRIGAYCGLATVAKRKDR
jgi:hypothetical protein